MSRDRVRIPIFQINNVYSSTNVSDSAWVQLVASLGDNVRELEIFDSGGQIMQLGYGAAGSEVNLLLIPQGGQGSRAVILNKGMRLAIKCATTSTTVSTGNLVITGYL